MDGRKLAVLALTIAAIGGVLYFKFKRRGEASDVVRAEVVEFIQNNLKGYEQNRSLIDGWVQTAHDRAFAAAYDMGGRRRGATFDEDAYTAAFFESLENQAKARNKKDLALAIRELSVQFDNSVAANAQAGP